MRTASLVFLPTLAALLAGCGVSEATFPAQYAQASCGVIWECYTSDEIAQNPLLQTLYGSDETECVAIWTAAIEAELNTDGQDCTYNGSAAGECLDEVEAMTCEGESDVSACDDVYDCGTGDSG